MFLEILAAAESDALLDAAADADRIPFWAALWDSAPALARWVVDRGGWNGVPVLELGCGAGLAGLAAAAAGARVTQTDLVPAAVALARENARRNGLVGVRQAAADWRAWPLDGAWPLVLGSDLLYERAAHAPLLAVLSRSVARGGAAYLSDPGRSMSRAFLARAASAGWSVAAAEAPHAPGESALLLFTLRPPS